MDACLMLNRRAAQNRQWKFRKLAEGAPREGECDAVNVMRTFVKDIKTEHGGHRDLYW